MVEVAVYVLGSSAAVPTRYRGLSCIAVAHRGSIYLFDVGEGCQHRLMEAGLSLHRVRVVAVTHLHGDHFLGLPGLLQSMSMLDRREKLVIMGPRGLDEYVETAVRITGHKPRFDIEVLRVSDGYTLRLGRVEIKAFPVVHTIESYGYVFQEEPLPGKLDVEKARRLGLEPGPILGLLKKGVPVRVGDRVVRPEEVVSPPRPGAKIVYTGDTAPTERVVEAARGATVLVHDATFTEECREEAHRQGHSTAKDAGIAASRAGAGLLVLTHFSARYRDPGPLVREARRFHPEVVAAEDYLMIPVRV